MLPSSLVPQGLNEKRSASDSLEKLQEEVAKLRIEMLLSKGESDLPEQWCPVTTYCEILGGCVHACVWVCVGVCDTRRLC